MKRDGNCLRPWGKAAIEIFENIRTTRPVAVIVKQARYPEHLAKLWIVAGKVANHDADLGDAEDSVEWAKMHIPSMRNYRVLLDGTTVVSTKSISYESMDQLAFSRFYDRAIDLWATKIGTDPETLLNEAAA